MVAAGRSGALERYVQVTGQSRYEMLLDPTAGAVVEETVIENGQLRMHASHRYIMTANDVLVRTGSRVDLPPTVVGQQSVVLDIAYSELSIEKR
jgi:hypothetical protein